MNSSFLCTNKGHLDHSLLLLPHLRTFDILSLERDLHVCKYLENSPRKSQFCFLIYFCCYFIPFSLNSHWSLLYSNLSNKLKCIKKSELFRTSKSICWAGSHLLWLLMPHWYLSWAGVSPPLCDRPYCKDRVAQDTFLLLSKTQPTWQPNFPVWFFPLSAAWVWSPVCKHRALFTIWHSSGSHRPFRVPPSLMCRESFLWVSTCVSPTLLSLQFQPSYPFLFKSWCFYYICIFAKYQ